MTSTPVKDVGSVLNSLTSAVGGSAKTAAGNGFQTVLNGQTGRSRTDDSQPDKSQTAVKKAPGESLKAKDAHRARVSEGKPEEVEETTQKTEEIGETIQETEETNRETEEIPAEKLEEVMEVLGTAAVNLMQQIADTFGISPEELEGAMQELGMDSLDVLDQEKLGALLLKLGGARDATALVTNGELYENYQELMTGLEETLQETAQEMGIDPEQLQAAIQAEAEEESAVEESAVEEFTVEEFTVEEIPVEVVRESQDPVRAEPEVEKSVDNRDVQEQEQTQQPVVETVENQPARENSNQSGPQTGRHQNEPDRSEHPHLFAQSFRTEQFQSQFSAQVQETAAASDAWRTDTQDIMRQIMDYMRIQLRPDTTSLEMQLHPESLGSLQIQIVSRGGMVTANFIAQNEAVKVALESQVVQLKESFEQQGVKIEAIEVTVQSHAFERNLDQGRGQSGAQEQSQAARRTRTRRINLNDPLETKNLEEEDALAAEMMAASGSQVDYTA